MNPNWIHYEQLPKSGLYLTAYKAYYMGELLGTIYKKRGFSYMGTQGWNRGIRLRDYHPIEWSFKMDGDHSVKGSWALNRKSAIEKMIEIKKKQ